MRKSQMPDLDISVIAATTGVGLRQPGAHGDRPAIANAIFNAVAARCARCRSRPRR